MGNYIWIGLGYSLLLVLFICVIGRSLGFYGGKKKKEVKK
jgi:hypothetical protein